MFGLTKREQRWKAEQAALEAFAPVLVALASAKTAPIPEPAKPNLGCATTAEDRDLLREAVGFCKGEIGRCDPVRMDKAAALILRLGGIDA